VTTMRDVAALAGVSAKTVSRVFNGDPHVLPETRTRVEDALRRLNYVPNALATTFRAGRAPAIGVAVPDLVDPFFASIAKAAADLAAGHDMSIVVTSLGDDPSREQPIVESLLRQSLSGLIIAAIAADQSYLSPWTSRTPVVFVDRAPRRVAADSFVADDHGGACSATGHLIAHGHRRIGFIGDTPAIPTTRDRLAGYVAALEAAGLPVDDDLICFGAGDRAGAAAALDRLRSVDDPPTALFSSNARCTMAAIPRLAGSGLAVTAFGDFPLADMLTPAMTVIDQDPAELGRLATRRILDRRYHPGRRYRRRTVLPVQLVERDSCFDLHAHRAARLS
jgi:LacI family transcriptional regulator